MLIIKNKNLSAKKILLCLCNYYRITYCKRRWFGLIFLSYKITFVFLLSSYALKLSFEMYC